MRILKRLLLLCLLTVMLVAATSVTALAADGDVCEIDGVGYKDLAVAINTATTGQTVKLIDSFTIDNTTNIKITDKSIKLDLNGCTVTSTVDKSNTYFITVGDGGSLTVQDSSKAKNGCIKVAPATAGNGFGIRLNSGSSFTMMSGTIDVTRTAVDIATSSQNINVNIKGGTIRSEQYVMIVRGSNNEVNITDGLLESNGTEGRPVIYLTADDETAVVNVSGGELKSTQDGTGQVISGYNYGTFNFGGDAKIIATNAQGITTEDNIKINISGGEIYVDNTKHSGRTAAISIDESNVLIISSGSITSAQGPALQVEGDSTADISGGEFISESSGYSAKSAVIVKNNGQVTISNGIFSDNADKGAVVKDSPTASVSISGGQFSSKPDDDVLVDGVDFTELEDGSITFGTTVAEINGKTYVRLSDAINEVKPGGTIKLLDNITLADNTALQFKEKGTAASPIILDLNGYDIIGANANTGTTYNSATPTGIIWIWKSHVILADSSTTGDKGSIINTANANNNTVLVTTSNTDGSASLLIKDGISIINQSSNTSAKAVNVYSYGDAWYPATVTVEDAVITSNGAIVVASDRDNLTLNIEGGIYTSGITPTKTTVRISYNENVAISGGTFINAKLDSNHMKRVPGDKAAIFSETATGMQQVVVSEVPNDYAAHLQHATRPEFSIVYLAAGEDELALLGSMITDNVTIEVNEDILVALNKEFGSNYGTPYVLTFDLGEGVTLSGGLSLKVADIIVAGPGTLADDFSWKTADDTVYEIVKEADANIWHGQLNTANRTIQVIKADGSVTYYGDSSTEVKAAFSAADKASGSTVKLLDNISLGATIVNGQYAVDLNGYTLTFSSSSVHFEVSSTGDLKLINSNSEQEGVVAANTAATNVAASIQGGSLTIGSGVKVTGNSILLEQKPGGQLTVYGTIDTTGTSNTPIMGNGSGKSDDTIITIKDGAKIIADASLGIAGIYHPQNGVLNIEGGEISGDSGIYMKAGTLNMTGGTVTGSGPKEDYTYDGGSYICTGDAIVLDACDYPGGAPAASIAGGEVASDNNQPVSCYLHENSTDINDKRFISGGSFSGDVSQYIENNYSELATAEGEHPFIVGRYSDTLAQEAMDNSAVAKLQVNDVYVYYPTLAAAINAAQPDAVITLLANTDEEIAIDKPLVILKNGYTATGISADSGYLLVDNDTSYALINEPADGVVLYDVIYYLDGVEQEADALTDISAAQLQNALNKTYDGYHLDRVDGPGDASVYRIYYSINVYSITIKVDGNGFADATPFSAAAGTEITLTTGAGEGSSFYRWQVLAGDVDIKDGKFIMPGEDVILRAIFVEEAAVGATDYYRLSFDTNGGSKIDSIRRAEGTVIKLSDYDTVREGYRFTGWYADKQLTDKISSVRLTEDTTVYAGWEKITANPFIDVTEKDWFYDPVLYVYENGLMMGATTTTFDPLGPTSRGMILTILYRMDGEPQVSSSNPFIDVPDELYYCDAITWAAANDIAEGYGNGIFDPNRSIPREQLAVFFYRYAEYKGYDVSIGEDYDLSVYTDADEVSDWAVPAVKWACATGLMQGNGGDTFDPTATSRRAEIAQMLYNFCENIY